MEKNLMDKIVALCKRRGFVYPTSEIYGGLANSYDYGPMGTELLRNIRNLWWKTFINNRDDMVGIDTQILLHPTTWIASGHVASFSDPVVEDKKTHKRYRADHLVEEWIFKHPESAESGLQVENLSVSEMADFIEKNKIASPEGNEITEPKKFNLLFETKMGVVEGEKSILYLRGETAQGIFTNFKNVLDSSRVKLPFGIGQIGKSFRNEITSGQFIFRTLELEQAEIEYFFDPSTIDWRILMDRWKKDMWEFVTNILGVDKSKLRWRQHSDKERSHYSKDTYDLDFEFPFGWKELWGIAYRTDYDLKQHMKHSGVSLEYVDSVLGKKFIPHVIEPAVGINRIFLMVLANAYREEGGRVYLALKPSLAPCTVAVFPLVANREDVVSKAKGIYHELKKAGIKTNWDARGNIGKRYFAQDEVGTPWCVTIDYQSLEDETVTVRERDTAKQERIKVSNLSAYFQERLKE